jgi:branched-chain amino acid transport system ATP-binding protein
MTKPLLEIQGIGKRFGGLDALKGVSLSLNQGETVSIIGPNGAGKTTLFQIVAGALKPDQGQITLNGARIDRLSPDQIANRGIARTFQNGRVFGNLSVLENVLVGAHARLQADLGAATRGPLGLLGALKETALAIVQPRKLRGLEKALVEEAKEILSLFGERLLPRLDHPTYSLSYANRRRTEIARALALHPQVLLLDEPTAGMNQTETHEVQELIELLQVRGQAILLIEHKLDMVMSVSNHVVALESGQILVQGRPDAVRNDPRLIEAYVGRNATTA